MASLGDIIVRLVADSAGWKAGLDKADAHTASFEKQSTSRFANIGNMFLKMFGGVMLVRQLAMMVAQMDEVNAALEKMKAQATYMFEETIRPGLPYIIEGIEWVGKALRGLLAVMKLLGSHLGSMLGAWYAIFTGKGIKNAIAAYKENMAAAWEETTKIFDESGKVQAKKKAPKAVEQKLTEAQKLLKTYREDAKGTWRLVVGDMDSATSEMGDMWAGMFKDMKADMDAYLEWFKRVEGYADSLAYTMAEALNGMQTSFKAWAQSVIMDIERVIIKMLILKAISAALGMLPGGGALQTLFNSAVGLATPSKSAPGPSIQIITADPATTVRIINGAYNRAGAGEQARLAQVVNRGAIVNVRR